MVYKAGERTGVQDIDMISFTLLASTYSIDESNAKVNLTKKTRLGTISN